MTGRLYEVIDTDTIRVYCTCPVCGNQSEIDVNLEKYIMWRNRMISIQDAFPELSVNDREKLMSGFCDECSDVIFREPEDDDEDIDLLADYADATGLEV